MAAGSAGESAGSNTELRWPHVTATAGSTRRQPPEADLEAGPSRSSTGTMTDGDAVVEAYIQTCLAGNVVDTSTAEAMVAEATCMLDDADERAQLAEAHSRAWQDRAELASSLLKAEENRTDRARAQKLEVERWAAAERDARQVIDSS